MNSIVYSDEFKKKVKPLSKKYHTLRESVDTLINSLLINPFIGQSYGDNIYKIRLADKSKGKGKSGGFRVIYYLAIKNNDTIKIILTTIYDKSELDNLTKKKVQLLLKNILNEL